MVHTHSREEGPPAPHPPLEFEQVWHKPSNPQFYSCTIESILTGCITARYGNSTALNRMALQRVVRTAQYITGAELPAIQDLSCGVKGRPGKLLDSNHPSHRLLSASAQQALPVHQV